MGGAGSRVVLRAAAFRFMAPFFPPLDLWAPRFHRKLHGIFFLKSLIHTGPFRPCEVISVFSLYFHAVLIGLRFLQPEPTFFFFLNRSSLSCVVLAAISRVVRLETGPRQSFWGSNFQPWLGLRTRGHRVGPRG